MANVIFCGARFDLGVGRAQPVVADEVTDGNR